MKLWPVVLLSVAACAVPSAQDSVQERPPNIIVIFTDDQGYGDLSSAGHPTIRTPHIDALARSGVRLTQFYVGASVCSPSRAALLTGCYPKRVGMHEHVVFPQDGHGLNPSEETLAELLRARGYATGCFGKWHLGHRKGLLPTDQGFAVFEGVPYSNDMAQFHRRAESSYRYRLPWMRGEEVVEWEPDQHRLTRRTTDAAIAFLDQHADQPFFLYLPYSMPHVPLFASEEFRGTSSAGLYGDVIEELDAAVGEIVSAVQARGLSDDTIIVFASDNGPWLTQGANGGSAGPLRGGKGTTWEGGLRVPAIVSAPGRLRAGTSYTGITTAMDLLPTLVAYAGAQLPTRVVDGFDLGPALRGEPDARVREEFLYYTSRGALAGIRVGAWKLLLDSGELYQLEQDISERRNRASAAPGRVASLRARALAGDAEITANARNSGTSEELVFEPDRDGA